MQPNIIACTNCGAPDDGQEVICKFCQQPVSAQVQQTAIPCGQCNHPNRWGRQQCSRCNAWIVVQCVFCGSLSPRTLGSCMKCNEAFAGAWQRKQAREGQKQVQEAEEILGSIAAISAGIFIGGRRW